MLYIIGRIYCDLVQPEQNEQETQPYTKWIYEKFNKCISTARFPDLIEFLSKMHCQARTEIVDQTRRIERAKEELIRVAEEKRQAQLAALAKKNEKGGAKKKPTGKKEEEEQKTIEVPKEIPKPQVEEKRELDLTNPDDFAQALREKVPRPFTFGPIELEGLDSDEFDMNAAYDMILNYLEQVSVFGESQICLNGYNILAKGRTLKRSSTLLKHARFLSNLQVTPVYPIIGEHMDEMMEMEGEMDD